MRTSWVSWRRHPWDTLSSQTSPHVIYQHLLHQWLHIRYYWMLKAFQCSSWKCLWISCMAEWIVFEERKEMRRYKEKNRKKQDKRREHKGRSTLVFVFCCCATRLKSWKMWSFQWNSDGKSFGIKEKHVRNMTAVCVHQIDLNAVLRVSPNPHLFHFIFCLSPSITHLLPSFFSSPSLSLFPDRKTLRL